MAKHKEEKTNVMRILDQKKIPYTARFYDDSEGPEGTREYGVHVAAALGQDPARGFKTLVARGASKGIYVFEVPVAENLDLKKAARAVGEGCCGSSGGEGGVERPPAGPPSSDGRGVPRPEGGLYASCRFVRGEAGAVQDSVLGGGTRCRAEGRRLGV